MAVRRRRRRSRAAAVLVAALLLAASAATASAASSYPAKVVTGLLSSTASAVVKQLWSLKSTATRTGSAAAGRSMVKYEGGYAVETVFDGSKLGIEPHDVEVTPSGELLVLDSMNSNVYRVQLPLSRYSRPKLVAGSPEGLSGHVDGRLREAKMNHPKGFTVDDRGNIYVADAMNMAIRKISDTGVTTIAGGKSMRGIALLFAAGFFGYMLALLQRQVLGMVSTADEPQTPPRPSIASIPPYQKPLKPSLRPPLIPTEDQAGKHEAEEGFFTSIGKLIGGAKSSAVEIFSRKKRPTHQYHHHLQQQRANPWPVQESYAIPHDETPPPLDMRAATPRKNYAFMTKEPEKVHHVRHGRPYFNGWDMQHAPQQQPEQQMYHQQHLQQHRQYSAGPQTFYEQSCETTNEIVFGAVQEVDTKRRMVEIKAVNYGDTFYEQYGMRYRNNYIGYNNSSNGNNNSYYY
ncbi:uncharacterized protein [Oryza sativa Japonica Group]|uniref:uncharacterized protein isoform X2 n=1 Tax=Oryza sativa subsp. japonica TaxID=39947 RepID=UPI0007754C5E